MASVESREDPAPTAKRAAIQASVLAATEALLAEGASYADLNIERIATRAGISRTAFYFYFRDKRELLMRLTEEVNELLYQQADIWFSGEGEPEPEMREALTNIAALYAEHGVLLRAIVEVSTYDEEVAQFWRGMLGRFVDASRRRIETEHAAGRAVVEHAAGDVVRAVLDDRAHDVPAPGPGRALRRRRDGRRARRHLAALGLRLVAARRLHRGAEQAAAEARPRDAQLRQPREVGRGGMHVDVDDRGRLHVGRDALLVVAEDRIDAVGPRLAIGASAREAVVEGAAAHVDVDARVEDDVDAALAGGGLDRGQVGRLLGHVAQAAVAGSVSSRLQPTAPAPSRPSTNSAGARP